MDILVSEGKLEFSGELDETTSEQSLIDCVMQAWDSSNRQGRVELDFSQVKHANSCGLMRWICALGQIKIPLVYVRCPVWLVENFSVIPDFFTGDIFVRDIYVIFYSSKDQRKHEFLYKVGEDLPFLESYDEFNLVAYVEGETLEVDLELGSYLSFLTENRAKLEKMRL